VGYFLVPLTKRQNTVLPNYEPSTQFGDCLVERPYGIVNRRLARSQIPTSNLTPSWLFRRLIHLTSSLSSPPSRLLPLVSSSTTLNNSPILTPRYPRQVAANLALTSFFLLYCVSRVDSLDTLVSQRRLTKGVPAAPHHGVPIRARVALILDCLPTTRIDLPYPTQLGQLQSQAHGTRCSQGHLLISTLISY
jgi:hypothetical protein